MWLDFLRSFLCPKQPDCNNCEVLSKCQSSLAKMDTAYRELETKYNQSEENLHDCLDGDEGKKALMAKIEVLEAKSDQLEYKGDMSYVSLKDGNWVNKVLKDYKVHLKRIPMDGGKIKDWYRVPLEEHTAAWIKWDLTDKRKYTLNDEATFDCDKFARVAWGRISSTTNGKWNHAGFVDDTSGAHAYLLFLTPDGKLKGYEPQNDMVWEWDSDKMKNQYDAESGFILL